MLVWRIQCTDFICIIYDPAVFMWLNQLNTDVSGLLAGFFLFNKWRSDWWVTQWVLRQLVLHSEHLVFLILVQFTWFIWQKTFGAHGCREALHSLSEIKASLRRLSYQTCLLQIKLILMCLTVWFCLIRTAVNWTVWSPFPSRPVQFVCGVKATQTNHRILAKLKR